MKNWLAELNRRNVIRLGIFYLVVGVLVIQVAALLFEVLGIPDWALFVLVGILLGALPGVLLFAWFFEVTEQGIRRASRIDRAESITAETAKRLNIMIIVLLLGVAGLFLIDRLVHPTFSDGLAPTPVEPPEMPDPPPRGD